MVGKIIKPFAIVMSPVMPLLAYIYYWVIRLRIILFGYSGLSSVDRKNKIDSGMCIISRETGIFSKRKNADQAAWLIHSMLLFVPDSKEVLSRSPEASLLSSKGIEYLRRIACIYRLLAKHNAEHRAMWRAYLAILESKINGKTGNTKQKSAELGLGDENQ